MSSLTNPLNTDFNSVLSNTVGFNLDDISKIEPFKDTYSTAWFVIFMSFIGAFLLLVGIALLYSLCDCFCPCCCGGSKPNRVRNGNKDVEMKNRG